MTGTFTNLISSTMTAAEPPQKRIRVVSENGVITSRFSHCTVTEILSHAIRTNLRCVGASIWGKSSDDTFVEVESNDYGSGDSEYLDHVSIPNSGVMNQREAELLNRGSWIVSDIENRKPLPSRSLKNTYEED